jgi:glycogen(starch) synthase
MCGRELGHLREIRREVAAIKATFAPDLVHANGVGPSLLIHLQTADACAAPWVLTLQQELLPSQLIPGESLLHRALSSAAWVAACSEAVLTQARELAPEIGSRSSVIRNTVDAPAPSPTRTREWNRLFCIGRLVPAKGFDVALTAVASLRARFPGLRLVIAGDGPMRRELETRAAELGLGHAVDFRGWVAPEEVPTLLDGGGIVLMPSRREGLGLVAVQAALMGCPIVASRVGGLPEVVVHEKTGLLVEREDPRGLADAIAFLLDHPDVAEHLGRAARVRTQDVFAWERCVDAYESLYTSVAGGRTC